jgi:MoaA/NifB/PqqE/SkfB family radical SAM enzyme
VNTTGDRADQAALSRAAGLGLKGIMVSLHSPVPEIHDSFTGRAGSFTVAHEAIRLAKSLGLGVCINSVLSEPELRGGALAALMDLARSLEVDFVQLIHPKPCGPWLDKEDGLALEPDLLARMESAHLHYNSWRTAGYPALSAQVFEERGASLGCTAGGIDRFYLTSSGEVLPCEFLQISFGNVLDEEFTVIFERMRRYFSVPGLDWPCCTKNKLISGMMKKHNLTATPLPWNRTRELMADWSPGPVTPLYERLGIYRLEGRK